ncbi:hypothetical protein [Actibacterium pelagium]|uniref:Uncharacterized protein n=1 Tax=Actibacterium pelagium TaxID=2029103 RepID=A0A917EPN6_9RHOB|nr:hypothetical protein [Actibacterium pelagium]GGE62908.1 hypothetical protein GCM10011517_33290 [Actibacterium pelagium]
MSNKSTLKALREVQIALEADEAKEALKTHTANKLDAILKELEHVPEGLAQFFVAAEITASAKAAEIIATHVMRPDEVTKLVATRKAEIAKDKAKRKAEREAAITQKKGLAN